MSYNSLGGVKVDELMRVADTQDQPIPGLYSAGVDSIGTRPGWRVLSQPVRRGAGAGASLPAIWLARAPQRMHLNKAQYTKVKISGLS